MTRDYWGLEGVTGGYKGLTEVTGGYKGVTELLLPLVTPCNPF